MQLVIYFAYSCSKKVLPVSSMVELKKVLLRLKLLELLESVLRASQRLSDRLEVTRTTNKELQCQDFDKQDRNAESQVA